MNDEPASRDLTRITLAVVFIAIMIVAGLWILLPFIGATVWATMVVVATWPILIALQARFGGRRWPAVTVMTLAMLLLLVVPLVLATITIVENSENIAGWSKSVATRAFPLPPEWVQSVPLVGPRVAGEWRRLATTPREELVNRTRPYIRAAVQWFAGQAGGLALMIVHFLLTVVITAVLYATGETAARGIRRFARRLAGDRGEDSVVLAGQAIRAVALGVVVTAMVQSAAAGIGLAVSGIPYASVLTAIAFMLCIAQIGPILVLAPAVGWLYWTGDPVWGTALLVWTVIVGALDNVLRPILIRRGADLPLLLIFAGVIGGLIGFGVIGLFVGPVVLAVTYRLLESWIADIDRVPNDIAPERVVAEAGALVHPAEERTARP